MGHGPVINRAKGAGALCKGHLPFGKDCRGDASLARKTESVNYFTRIPGEPGL